MNILSPNTRIRNLFRWGKECIIDDFCYISCCLFMGDYCHISASCTFLGGSGIVTLGNFVNIAPGCRIVTAGHNYKWGGLNGPTIPKEYKGLSEEGNIEFEDHVLIGANSVILPGVELPEGVAVGALSLVPEGIYRPWSLYAGIPVRRIGPRYGGDILKQAERLINESNPG